MSRGRCWVGWQLPARRGGQRPGGLSRSHPCQLACPWHAVYPSTDAPGGLAPDQTPQFILFTVSDGIC